jgi:COP9 signalosome complex subunit 6
MERIDGLDVRVHPLLLVNVSDHATRFRCCGRTEPVVGAVLGVQDGRRVDFLTAFELTLQAGHSKIDDEDFKRRCDLYAEVFPKYEVLGWYTTGDAQPNLAMHKQAMQLSGNEALFCCLLRSEASVAQSEDIPLQVLEMGSHMDGDKQRFDIVPFTVESTESERIATEHVTRSATTQTSGGYASTYHQNLGSLGSAVGMLLKRLEALHQFAVEVEAGARPWNHQALREIKAVLDALAATPPEELRAAQLAEQNDALLSVYLSTMTKTSAHVSDLLQSFSQVHERKARRGFLF